MKRIISLIVVIAAAVSCIQVSGQDHQDQTKNRPSREKLAEAQAEYMVQTLALNEDVAKKFVETYKACQQEIQALIPARSNRKASTTEAEAEEAIKQQFERSRKILDIRERYYGEYSKFLTQLQIERVYRMEERFAKRMSSDRDGNKPGKREGRSRHSRRSR